MNTKLIQPTSQVIHSIPRIKNTLISHKPVHKLHKWTKNTRFCNGFRPICSTIVAELSSGEDNKNNTNKSIAQVKSDIYQAVQGINRGIFGVPIAKKTVVHDLVKLLESQNPTPNPTTNLDKVGGCWKLVYSTITILGSKRTKLGLRDFISLGDFFQIIDVAQSKAVNVIRFNVRGLNLLNGKLTIEASFKITSESRVEITYDKSIITPDQLMNMFCKNYDLLLGIFNPEGWLEITYLDENFRVGRDDKENIFILERSEETAL